MDKKLLICGSSIAVVILVLASLSPVVGYNSVKPSTELSPLFTIRTNRATNQDGDNLTCSYIGQGKRNNFPFDKREYNVEKTQIVIETISMMDDTAFNKLIGFIINQVNKDKNLKQVDTKEITAFLYQLRSEPELIKSYIDNGNDYGLTSEQYCSIYPWSPGCWLLNLLVLIISNLVPFIVSIMIIISVMIECYTLSDSCLTQACIN